MKKFKIVPKSSKIDTINFISKYFYAIDIKFLTIFRLEIFYCKIKEWKLNKKNKKRLKRFFNAENKISDTFSTFLLLLDRHKIFATRTKNPLKKCKELFSKKILLITRHIKIYKISALKLKNRVCFNIRLQKRQIAHKSNVLILTAIKVSSE